MAVFHYEAMNMAGQAVRAEVTAASAEEALVKIRTQGHFPTKVREQIRPAPPTRAAKKGWTLKGITFGGVSNRAMAEFTQQLSILQDAGLPIVRSLKILWQQEKPGVLKNVLAAVAESVEDGQTLSEAMAHHPRAFSRLYVKMVQAGETGGVLDVILQRLAEFMDKAQRLKRRVIGAMIYPAAVIGFSVLIVTGIMMWIVPKFQEIFRDFRITLPSITVWLIGTANFVAHHYGWVLILGAPAGLYLLVRAIRKSAAGRFALDTLMLRLPVVGQIVAKTAVARFARTLGTLLAAGVPILDAINITRETVGNVVFSRALGKVHDAIREGETFATPLRAARVCDPIVVNMIDVGEETGELDKMLMKLADTYEDRVDVLVNSLVSLLEPVMVIVLGGIVGTIVVALFLPLVTIIQDMNKA